MATEKKAVTIYLQPDLFERLRAAAEADDRSITNFVERMISARLVQTISNNHSLQTEGDLRRGGRQVDLEEAISIVKRAPSKSAKHK